MKGFTAGAEQVLVWEVDGPSKVESNMKLVEEAGII
jgi:hypothetical protein